VTSRRQGQFGVGANSEGIMLHKSYALLVIDIDCITPAQPKLFYLVATIQLSNEENFSL